MIIWNNIIKNSILIFINILLIISIILINRHEKNDEALLIFFSSIFLSLFVNISSITYIIKKSPCFIKAERMNYQCIACWDNTKSFGIRCQKCKNIALCEICFLDWVERNNSCPLCRNKYEQILV